MILVTTHQGADFDSYAGVFAASLLHPGSVTAFPGSKEPALRAYLAATPEISLPELRVKDIDLAAVRTLVLVDTVSAERIGPFGKLLEPPGRVQVVCYDHHPQNTPPKGATLHVGAVGAVTTLMLPFLRARGIRLSPPQATLLAIGIYEDTGGLLHAGTTPDDLKAVAWLIEEGADLGQVARTLARGLTPMQVELYHEILQGARTVRFKGRQVVVATVASAAFVPDASVVVQQYVQATGTERFAALLRMEDRIFLIVRSRAPDLDARAVAAAFGGGGHGSAASAVLHGKTLVEAHEALLAALEEAVIPTARASDLMTPVLYTVDAGATVGEAVRRLNRYRVNALPVLEHGSVTGALTRQLADVALHHGMADRRVKDLVVADVDLVPPSADLETLRRRLLQGTLRFILVGEDRAQIRGIVTRTALLRHLYEERIREREGALLSPAPDQEAGTGEDVSSLLGKLPSGTALEVLETVSDLTAASGMQAYLVGGVVRDLLLRRETADLDLVVEGDAAALARLLASKLAGQVRAHEVFQTAVVFLESGLRIDFASARTEHYRGPAALPEIAPGGIRQDLFRRDFTINALAVRLTRPGFGRLIDFFGGRKDLRDGKIRVLHGLSFIEDPTRAFRAVRFASELGFEISRETAHLIRVATEEKVFDRLSSVRLRREVERVLGGRRPTTAVRMLLEHRLLTVLHPRLRPSRRTYARLERAEETLSWHRLSMPDASVLGWTVVLAVLAESLSDDEREELLTRLHPGRRAALVLRSAGSSVHRILAVLAPVRSPSPSLVVETCRGEPTEIVLLAMAFAPREELRGLLGRFLTHLRSIRPDIDGRDLLRAGVLEGPAIAAGLWAALRAKLDGAAPDAGSQLRAALAELGET